MHGARLLLIDSMLTAAVLVATTAAKPQLAQLLSRATDLETSAGDTTSGIHGPFPLSTDGWRECVAGWEHVQKKWKSLGLIAHPYPKSAHAHVPACRALAMQPALLREMRAVIGTDDLIVATMSVLVKEVGWEHRWHTDVENAIDRTRCNDTSWTVWLPLDGTAAPHAAPLPLHSPPPSPPPPPPPPPRRRRLPCRRPLPAPPAPRRHRPQPCPRLPRRLHPPPSAAPQAPPPTPRCSWSHTRTARETLRRWASCGQAPYPSLPLMLPLFLRSLAPLPPSLPHTPACTPAGEAAQAVQGVREGGSSSPFPQSARTVA